MIEGRAVSRYVRGSVQKAKLVFDVIRGQDVNAALATLRFTRKAVARDIEKVLRSAVANAQQKEGASGDAGRLYIGDCHANQGPSLKRIRPAPMGRAFRILKRTSHLSVTVRERSETATGMHLAADDAPRPPALSPKSRGTHKTVAAGGEVAPSRRRAPNKKRVAKRRSSVKRGKSD